MKKEKQTKKMGRPSKIEKIDWEEFDNLCSFQCTEEEIASWYGVGIETIKRAVKQKKGMTFEQYFSQKRKKGLLSLRRRQMQMALAGDKTLMIWLGKQYLSQKDRSESDININQLNEVLENVANIITKEIKDPLAVQRIISQFTNGGVRQAFASKN